LFFSLTICALEVQMFYALLFTSIYNHVQGSHLLPFMADITNS
jgi:hypothetical protein